MYLLLRTRFLPKNRGSSKLEQPYANSGGGIRCGASKFRKERPRVARSMAVVRMRAHRGDLEDQNRPSGNVNGAAGRGKTLGGWPCS